MKLRRAGAVETKTNILSCFCRRANRIALFHSLRLRCFIVAPRASRSVQENPPPLDNSTASRPSIAWNQVETIARTHTHHSAFLDAIDNSRESKSLNCRVAILPSESKPNFHSCMQSDDGNGYDNRAHLEKGMSFGISPVKGMKYVGERDKRATIIFVVEESLLQGRCKHASLRYKNSVPLLDATRRQLSQSAQFEGV